MIEANQRDEMKQAFRNNFIQLAQQYLVPDIIPDEATFLFLLESPHVQELKFGAPVSGSSGTSMTKHLFGVNEKFPIGRLVQENAARALNRPSLNKVGLMNVCHIPLQGSAYQDQQVLEQYRDFFKILESIRTSNNKISYAASEWNMVQEILAENLRHKLELLTDRSFFIIPCGRFAQKFFRLANVSSLHWRVIEGVPHPSYNGWSKPEYAAVVQQVVETFQ